MTTTIERPASGRRSGHPLELAGRGAAAEVLAGAQRARALLRELASEISPTG